MSYTPIYKKPYEQWKELPSKETLVTAEVLTQYDDTFENIEEYLESEGEKEYALVTEAGYSIVASIDEYYVLTVVLKNKAGEVLSTSEPIDLPIESMIINVDYDEESGILTFSLQNGQTLDVNISTLVRGLVPTSRKIAGVDLEDDITEEELKEALGYLTETDIAELNTSSAVAYYESEINTAITAPAQNYTDMAKITLPIGTYVVQSSFKSNTNGFRFYQGLQVNDEYLRDTRYDSMSLVASTWSTIVRLTKETELVYRLWVDKEAIIDETQIRAVRINYNAEELDDVKSSIASVSDEVDAVEEKVVTKNMPQGTDLNNLTTQGIYFFDNYATNYINTPSDNAHNGIMTVDAYYYKTENRTKCVQRYTSLNLNTTFERVQLISGTWTAWERLSKQSDIDAINSRLAYKDISSSIDVGDSGCTALGYVENGQVIIRITYPAGAKGDKRLNVDIAYGPRMTVYGSANGNASDFGKLTTSLISPEGIIFVHASEEPEVEMTAIFTYPLKTS